MYPSANVQQTDSPNDPLYSLCICRQVKDDLISSLEFHAGVKDIFLRERYEKTFTAVLV